MTTFFSFVSFQAANEIVCSDLPITPYVIRVLQRVFDLKTTKARPRTDDAIWAFLRNITPEGKARQLNPALIDFGSMICTARKPKCPICPLQDMCQAYKNGRFESK
jgi:A/G-specific adenine glycosylase